MALRTVSGQVLKTSDDYRLFLARAKSVETLHVMAHGVLRRAGITTHITAWIGIGKSWIKDPAVRHIGEFMIAVGEREKKLEEAEKRPSWNVA